MADNDTTEQDEGQGTAKVQKSPDSDPKAGENLRARAKALEDAQPKLSPNEDTAATVEAPDEPDASQQVGGPTARAQAHHDPPGGFKDVEKTGSPDELPSLAEGQVWEDLAPGHTEHGRRLRVLTVGDPEDGESKVRVRNLQTEVESEIRLDRFHVDEGAFRRVV